MNNNNNYYNGYNNYGNGYNGGYGYFPPPPPPKKKNNSLIFVLIAVAVLFLLFIIIVIASFTAVISRNEKVTAKTTLITAATDSQEETAYSTEEHEYIYEQEPIPEIYTDNYYLQSIGMGGCDTLTGDVKIFTVFVDDDVSTWSDSDKQAKKRQLAEIAEDIEAKARSYGKVLNISFVYKTAYASGTISSDYYQAYTNSALSSAGLPQRNRLNDTLEEQYGVKEAPVMLCVNHHGRSFAISNSPGEFIALFATNDEEIPFAHELYHVFGANDYYYPDDVQATAEQLFPDTVMISSYNVEVDDLTAYIIGWDDSLTDKAQEFLAETNSITDEYIENEHERETYTGNVTNYRMSNGYYTGYLHVGEPHGEGVYEYNDGDVYAGKFEYGYYHGEGTLTWADGDKYVGSFVYGERTGKGTYIWSNGIKYEGDFVDGERIGEGTLTMTDGDRYIGSFVDGKCTGKGTYIWADGDKYIGDFEDDKRTGYGVYYWTNGDKFEGYWENGKRNGQGKLTYASGKVKTGIWSNDEYVG